MKGQAPGAGFLALVVVVLATALLRAAYSSRSVRRPEQALPLDLPAVQPIDIGSSIKRQAPRAGFLALVALLATAVMGAAYAMWSEDLKLDAQAASGTLDGTLVCNSLAVPDDAEAESEPDGTHAYGITVTGVHPGETIQCTLKITNTGTTAWHLEEQSLDVVLPNNTSYAAVCAGHPGNCVAGGTWPEPAGGNPKPLYVSVNDLHGCQVHAGESIEATLFVGVNEQANPETTYKVEIDFKVHQWNESEWDGCGDPRAALPPSGGRAS